MGSSNDETRPAGANWMTQIGATMIVLKCSVILSEPSDKSARVLFAR
jgi:hypothetical protein